MEERVPEIRFKGFEEEWTQQRLGDIAKLNGRIGFRGYTEKDIVSKEDGGILAFSPTNIVDNVINLNCKNTYITRSKFEESPEIQIHNGDIIFVKTGSTLGKSALISNLSEEATLNPQVVVLRVKNNEQFFASLMTTKDVMDQINSSKIGGAVPTLTETRIKDFSISIPISNNEKNNLGNLFHSMDTLITLQQQKLDKLKTFKKSCLEKMFPKDGKTVPEVRFKGFEGPWEKNSFSKITYPSGEKNRDNLPLESYSITNEKGFVPQDEKFENGGTMRDADKKMYYIVSPQSFAYNPARINVGSIGYQNLSKEVIVSSLYEVFKTTDDVDDRFLWHWFKSDSFQHLIEQLQEGGVRLYFYYDKLCQGQIALPSIEEQRLIGGYLDKLDVLLIQQQQKLDKLKALKQACLEKMFV